MTPTPRQLAARLDLERIDRIESGQASTKDFELMGLPFEAFLRYAQQGPDTRRFIAAKMRERRPSE